jgi:ATP-dependent DNA helicase RecQ
VARVKQTWGLGHVTDILVGRATDKVVASGHAQLSTFGLLTDEPAVTVRGYVEQLIDGGFLARAGEPYPVLRLTASGAALLRGEVDCALYREIQPKKSTRRKPRDQSATVVDRDLFDVLREVRLRLARERGVPPYVIFHDTTLRDMVQRRPGRLADLYDVYGVGVKKATDFGEVFLDAIRTFRSQKGVGRGFT